MKTYKSKIDLLLISGPFLLFVGMFVFMWVNNEPLQAVLTTNGILLAVALFILYLAYNTEYVIENKELHIKCGFLYRRHLEISRIKFITKTNNPISAPAASLDRIEISYDEFGIVVISPKNREAFTNNLLKINPGIIDKITK